MSVSSGCQGQSPRILAVGLVLVSWLAGAVPVGADPFTSGMGYLTASQQPDGSWQSTEVRRVHATVEALRALQMASGAPAARSAAASRLELEIIEDSDDRARRISALSFEGRSVTTLVTRLLADGDPKGGWGLTAGFIADPLDTALALSALASQPAAGDGVLRLAFSSLLQSQKADGSFPCMDSGDDDPGAVFCTSQALLALAPYRGRYSLEDSITAATGFLRGRLNAGGSFGAAGPNEVIQTALASQALAAVPAFGNDVAAVISWLQSRQQPDGSWDGDPYPTALAVQALKALTSLPYCGDLAVNGPGEACDGGVPAGLTCERVGLGSGTLACSSRCTLDTSGCSSPPVCGDNLRNQPFEVCDGADLAGAGCESLGFAAGTLACTTGCRSFDVGECSAEPTCGDGVINRPEESCDLNDLQGATCGTLGLGGGLLRCAPDCTLDTGECDAASFAIDNKGREFFVGFMPNLEAGPVAQLHLTSEVPTSVTIEHPAGAPTFVQTVPVSPGEVTVVDLPDSTHNAWNAGLVLDNSVRVSAPEEIVVYLVNRAAYSSDVALGLPVDALGMEHFVMSYWGATAHPDDRTQFLVVAPFDDTTVTITSRTDLVIPPPGEAPSGVPYQIKLNRGEGFRGEAAAPRNTMAGTRIVSDRPVAVLNGHICGNIPMNVWACDHLFEMAHPLSAWGKLALVANLPNRPNGSVYRVLASEDGTRVVFDNASPRSLQRGQFFDVGPVAGNHVFSANLPIFVAQFMTGYESPGAFDGDPSMVNVIPPDQFQDSYTFSTVGGDQFKNHFLTVIAPDAALGSVLLDGVPIAPAAFSPIRTSGFSAAIVPLTPGAHTTSSPFPHGITVEGYNRADSYAYPGGTRIEVVNAFCGDGEVNRSSEECDGADLGGTSCIDLGFAGGLLRCAAGCGFDRSECAGFVRDDADGDGFTNGADCADQDARVNPGMPELPGNGLDDDCNAGTPDVFPWGAVSCRVIPDRFSYGALDVVALDAEMVNGHSLLSLTGVTASVLVRGNRATPLFEGARDLPPLLPGDRSQRSFTFSLLGHPPGPYYVQMSLVAGGEIVGMCDGGFVIESTADSGEGLSGALSLAPPVVDPGNPSDISYSLANQGNAALSAVAVRVRILGADSGGIVGELTDSVALAAQGSFSGILPFSTEGLVPGDYLVVLTAKPGQTGVQRTLASAVLTVLDGNAQPDCSGASAKLTELWPPNHRFIPVTVGGVTDPDGDPVTLKVTAVTQDEPVNDTGDGTTCPDAEGIGTAAPRVRAERGGLGDGRVYHLGFEAEDGNGGTCEGTVTVCVPHDRNGSCMDQGRLFDSSSCPGKDKG